MAGVNIEGDLSQLSEPQIKYIKSVIEQRGYTNNKVVFEAVGKAGDNYVANVKRIIIDDGKGGTFNMVAKIAPKNEALRMVYNVKQVFENEHIMYTKVFPKYTGFEKAAGIPPEERLRYAACYGSSGDAPNEVILLEDLNVSKFQMLDRLKELEPDCVKSVLRNFALLHSLSYVLKKEEPELFDELKNSFFDMWGQIGSQKDTMMHFQALEENAFRIVGDDRYKKAIKRNFMSSFKDPAKIKNTDKYDRHAVILQGDSWTNNIMFKFDGDNLQESMMIDYQLSKIANPVFDILYMIFNCTNYETRKKHFYEWIDYYHTELDKSLSNFGIKASFVYPRDQLDADLKRYAKFSFGQSTLLALMLSLKSDEASAIKEVMESTDIDDSKQSSIVIKDPETVALIKKRIEGLVDSFQEFGLI